jgi:ATP phosphoribosyltransferase regulatory subunit
MNKLLHIPEGYRDIYREECKRRQVIRDRLMNALSLYGYDEIVTPTVEYFDIFGKEIGTTPSRELYKFFDREGNTIVLRPDFTPSVARAASTYFNDEKRPGRFSYQGSVFHNNDQNQGRLREYTQIGAELIGNGSIDEDAEIISLVSRMIHSAGINDFRISLSHSGIFGVLIREAGLNDDDAFECENLIRNRNFFGLREFLKSKNISDKIMELFNIFKPSGSEDEIDSYLSLAADYPDLSSYLSHLLELKELLKIYGCSRHVSFDFGQIKSFSYYTGIIFSAYTYGSGEAILRGGRYDSLLHEFGRNSPAIGFAFSLDLLISAIERQQIPVKINDGKTVIIYTDERKEDAIKKADELRDKGIPAEIVLAESDSLFNEIKSEYTDADFIVMRGMK